MEGVPGGEVERLGERLADTDPVEDRVKVCIGVRELEGERVRQVVKVGEEDFERSPLGLPLALPVEVPLGV